MNKIHCYLFIITLLTLTSCDSTEDDIFGEEQPVKVETGAYTEECRWIYRQMNRHYLWREDLPDSASCDYTQDPVSFFKALLSSKDRFSYCERNTNYIGPQEIRKSLEDDYALSITRATSENVLLDTIYTFEQVKVGYLCYNKFEDVSELVPVISKFYEERISELIIDLRYNPGGYVSTCKYLCNSVVNESGYGKVFQSQGFNDILTAQMLQQSGYRYDNDFFEYPSNGTTKKLGTPLYGLNMKRIYVLTSIYTASASEAFILCLRPYNDVVVIGEKTVGKGVGSYTIRDSKYKYELHPITLRYFNADEESTPEAGIEPNYIIKDGYLARKKEIGKVDEPLLHKALSLILELK